MPTHHCSAAHTVYWHAAFHPPFARLVKANNATVAWEAEWDGPLPADTLTVRLFISHVDAAGAKANSHAELTAAPYDLDVARRAAKDAWERVLGRVDVAMDSRHAHHGGQLTTFYTALYHSFLGPTLYPQWRRNPRRAKPSLPAHL